MLFVAGRKTVKKRKCLLPSTNKELSVRQVVQHVVDGGTSNPQSPSASTRPNQVDSNLRDDAVAVGRETHLVHVRSPYKPGGRPRPSLRPARRCRRTTSGCSATKCPNDHD